MNDVNFDMLAPVTAEAVKNERTVQREDEAKESSPLHPEEAGLLQKLSEKYPEAHFTAGNGFETSDSAALLQMGRGNIMVDAQFLHRLTQKPDALGEYEHALDRLIHSFGQLFEQAGGIDRDLVAWGTFINSAGFFNSWGVTSPFSNTLPVFEFFDRELMRDIEKFEESEWNRLIEDETQILHYEQSLEKAEEAFDKMHERNPHIQDKEAAPGADRLGELFSAGVEKDEGRRLDIKE